MSAKQRQDLDGFSLWIRRFQETQRTQDQKVATLEGQVVEGLKITQGVRGEVETFQGRVVETLEDL